VTGAYLNLAIPFGAAEDGATMRIECPACAAAYEVPDRLLAGPARTLRCSRCGADFALPQGAAPEPAVVAPPDPARPAEARPMAFAEAPRVPEPLASRALAPIPPSTSISPALASAWVASIAMVGGAVFAFFYFQAGVMAVWPASTRLYAALGLA
jgi:predicted Zn finger-like uncharacterized protein